MEFPVPSEKGFTVYSKSGCINCTSVKSLLQQKFFTYIEINCDEYILENKEGFLKFIEEKAETSYKTFPMVFYNNKFVGGLAHTKEFVDKSLLSFEDNF